MRHVLRRSIGSVSLLLAMGLVLATAHLSALYLKDGMEALVTFAGPAAALVGSVALLWIPRSGERWGGTKWGFYTGSTLFALLQAFTLVTRYRDILADGVGYWVFVHLPSLYIALPLCVVGTLIGVSVDLVRRRVRALASDTDELIRSALDP